MNLDRDRLVRMQACLLAVFAFGACRSETRSKALEGQTLALVDGQAIQSGYLLAVKEQLGPYAHALFSGPGGNKALLASLIDLELLHAKAKGQGLEHDPRVRWALIEAKARMQTKFLQERKVPRATIEGDPARLERAILDHPTKLMHPERRAVWFASYETWDEAYKAHEALRSGILAPQDTPAHDETMPMVRNDEAFPVFHRLLFAPELTVGEYLPEPVPYQDRVWVARLSAIEEAKPFDLEDPRERAQVVDTALRAPQGEALAAYLRELAKIWPCETK